MKYKKIINMESSKYKYVLLEDMKIKIPYPHSLVHLKNKFYEFDEKSSTLTVLSGYCWDGASGPAIDTENFMRGSLFHDCLYQMIREGELSRNYRKAADKLLHDICVEDGMSKVRAGWVYMAVRVAGGMAI